MKLENCWIVKFKVRYNQSVYVSCFENILECKAISFSKDKNNFWIIESYFHIKPIKKNILNTLSIGSKLANEEFQDLSIKNISGRDWLLENSLSFPAVSVGRFIFYGNHLKPSNKSTKIKILLNSANSFGSGNHPTTKGCILALEYLHKFFMPKNILDLGAGSGVLSIVAAFLWKSSKIDALDIDITSVKASNINFKKNHLSQRIKAEKNNGKKLIKIKSQKQSIDLIISNILISPLKILAYNSALKLSKNGYIVLSGVLNRQLNDIISIYSSFGLVVCKKIKLHCWSTVIMKNRE